MTAQELEGLARGLLHNAAARQWAASRAEPEVKSAEYLTGFAAGHEAGEVAAMALIVSLLSGESATALIDEVRAQAAVDAAFPFDLEIEFTSDDEAA